MGSSASGILVYGVDLGIEEEFEFPEEFNGGDEAYLEFDYFIYREAGLPEFNPNASDDDHDEFFKKRREVEQAYPVDLVRHGHHEYNACIIAARGSEYSSCDWTDTTEIDPQDMLDMSRQREDIMTWMESHGFEVEEPKWHLCASYG